jgi:two-component system, sensor histidine kinase SagS
LSTSTKILIVGDPSHEERTALDAMGPSVQAVTVPTILRGLALLSREDFAGIYVNNAHLQEAFQVGKLLQNEWILEEMPEGVLLLDSDNTIIWGNARIREWSRRDDVAGVNFYEALHQPEILGPDYCPFQTALAGDRTTTSTLRAEENRYFQVHATPVREAAPVRETEADQIIENAGVGDAAAPADCSSRPAEASDGSARPRHLLVVLRDVSREILQQQKLVAIHQAGIELADLTPEVLATMTMAERVELLKSNILHFTQYLLHFDVVEIRLLERSTGRLVPLVAVGMTPDAAARELYALPEGNGVTGFVAATGKSYLCENAQEDPLYLQGCVGAKSSLTVPLLFHEDVIGTFNVESPNRGAFSESDLQFLEIFARDVAAALHTLELLVAEQATSTAKSVEAIHSAVALPIDEILNDAVNVMERYIGHEPELVDRLRRILRNARDIKEVIQKVGRTMTPAQAMPLATEDTQARLRGKQVLVVDPDESVRSDAHRLLERYGCVVETAHDGGEAVSMVRSGSYDAILVDLRLPDMSGYELLVRLQESMESVPMVLMTGFGYDAAHTIVKARQAGLKQILYKPFRLDQLLDTVERVAPIPGLAQKG